MQKLFNLCDERAIVLRDGGGGGGIRVTDGSLSGSER